MPNPQKKDPSFGVLFGDSFSQLGKLWFGGGTRSSNLLEKAGVPFLAIIRGAIGSVVGLGTGIAKGLAEDKGLLGTAGEMLKGFFMGGIKGINGTFHEPNYGFPSPFKSQVEPLDRSPIKSNKDSFAQIIGDNFGKLGEVWRNPAVDFKHKIGATIAAPIGGLVGAFSGAADGFIKGNDLLDTAWQTIKGMVIGGAKGTNNVLASQLRESGVDVDDEPSAPKKKDREAPQAAAPAAEKPSARTTPAPTPPAPAPSRAAAPTPPTPPRSAASSTAPTSSRDPGPASPASTRDPAPPAAPARRASAGSMSSAADTQTSALAGRRGVLEEKMKAGIDTSYAFTPPTGPKATPPASGGTAPPPGFSPLPDGKEREEPAESASRRLD